MLHHISARFDLISGRVGRFSGRVHFSAFSALLYLSIYFLTEKGMENKELRRGGLRFVVKMIGAGRGGLLGLTRPDPRMFFAQRARLND